MGKCGHPLLSVIVPVYNCEKYLGDCIRSIQKQDYKALEIILVDDGSTDTSKTICDRYAEQDQRIRVYHQQNGGQSVARNFALDLATGVYVTFIDADDYYMSPNVFSICVQLIDKNETLDFVQFPYEKDGVVHNMQDLAIDSATDKFRYWLTDKTITNYLWDKIFRKRVFETLRMPVGMIFEDRYVFADILKSKRKVLLTSFNNRGGYFYRTHGAQTTMRKKDSFFLESEIKADVHILNTMPQQLTKLYLLVCWRVIANMILLKDGYIPISKSVRDIISVDIPIGIKLRLVIIKMIGIKTFLKLHK